MAAVSELSSVVTEFPGTYKVAAIKVNGAPGTTGTLQIEELSNIVAVTGQLCETPTVDCAAIVVKPNTTAATNVISCILYEDDLITANTRTALDYFVIAVGY